MALLAEEIVEEWLNRQGYFTIRGIKIGVQEIDMLAVRFKEDGGPECRHIEVQASMRPVSFISRVPKDLQIAGRAANSAKRSQEELEKGVQEWVEKKFQRSDKIALMKKLWNAKWSSELVLNNVKSQDEVNLIQSHGIKILWLKDIILALSRNTYLVSSAGGADFVDLIQSGASSVKKEIEEG
jgi:hypothetical protein